MLFTSIALVFPLLAIANGSPVSNAGGQTIARRQGTDIPSDIPPPPAAQCSLLVFSDATLPLGGTPTSGSGEGIGPSSQGGPEVTVINVDKQIVGGPTGLADQNPGFAASMALDSHYINSAQTVSVSATQVSPSPFAAASADQMDAVSLWMAKKIGESASNTLATPTATAHTTGKPRADLGPIQLHSALSRARSPNML